MKIEHFTITRFEFRRDRIIGDAQVRSEFFNVGVLELHTDTGITGTGFFLSLFARLPAQAELTRLFAEQVFSGLRGGNPFALLNRVTRPRGGNRRGSLYRFEIATNQALWDLQGQHLQLPLYRLLGGTSNRVAAYASGLDYHLTDDQYREFFRQATTWGFAGYKIKVGHPDLEWDLRRLQIIREVVGDDARIMVDANESWSPSEAIHRIHAYHDAGFRIYWVEDPILREDFASLRRVIEATPFTRINAGEYLDLEGKRQLLEAKATDVINIHGHVSDSMQAGRLAAQHGIPVSLGNTEMEIGVHLAAALPEVMWMEYSFHNWAHLLESPVEFKDGYAYAPERPGHGLKLSEEARARYTQPELRAADELAAESAPYPIIDLTGV